MPQFFLRTLELRLCILKFSIKKRFLIHSIIVASLQSVLNLSELLILFSQFLSFLFVICSCGFKVIVPLLEEFVIEMQSKMA